MTLDEAIQHALDKSKAPDLQCSLEHMQLAAWLTELRILRETLPKPYIRADRRTQVRNAAGEWVDKPFHDLKAGDVFRCLELDGTVADTGTQHEVCICRGAPFIMASAEAGVFTLGVQCDPEKPGEQQKDISLGALGLRVAVS